MDKARCGSATWRAPASSTAAVCWPVARASTGRSPGSSSVTSGRARDLQARDGDLVVARRAGMPGGGEGRQLVTRLAGLGAAGLVFVDGHYLTGALAGVRATADEAGLPLFALPRGIDATAAGAALEAARAGGGATAAAGALRAGCGPDAGRGRGRRARRRRGARRRRPGLGAALQDPAGRRLVAAGETDGPRIAVHAVTGGELALYGSGAGALAEPLLAQAAALVAARGRARRPGERVSGHRREARCACAGSLAAADGDEPGIVLVVAGGAPALAARLRELGASCGRAAADLVAILPATADLDRVATRSAGTAWGAGPASRPTARRPARGPRGPPRSARPSTGHRSTTHVPAPWMPCSARFGPDGAAALADACSAPLPPEVACDARPRTGVWVYASPARQGRLFVHKNTVRYRLDDVAEILSVHGATTSQTGSNSRPPILGIFCKRFP